MTSITVEEIVETQLQIAKEFNIPPTVINHSSLALISAKPDALFYGKLMYNDIFKKAACLVEGIIRLHPFVDGNKRTSFGVADYFLKKHGYVLVLPPETTQYAVKIARNDSTNPSEIEMLIHDIAVWLKANSKRIDVHE